MKDSIFGGREKAIEEAYFRDQDAKLLEKLRRRAHLDEIAVALGDKLHIKSENPELLHKVPANWGLRWRRPRPSFFHRWCRSRGQQARSQGRTATPSCATRGNEGSRQAPSLTSS